MISLFKKIKDKRLYSKLKKIKGLSFASSVNFRLTPVVIIHPEASISIGDHSTINSDQKNYHLNLFAPCKLMADKKGAEIKIGSKTRIHGSCVNRQQKVD